MSGDSRDRFKVTRGSESGSSLFSSTVVDRDKSDIYEPVCECYDTDDAEMVCRALNYYFTMSATGKYKEKGRK